MVRPKFGAKPKSSAAKAAAAAALNAIEAPKPILFEVLAALQKKEQADVDAEREQQKPVLVYSAEPTTTTTAAAAAGPSRSQQPAPSGLPAVTFTPAAAESAGNATAGSTLFGRMGSSVRTSNDGFAIPAAPPPPAAKPSPASSFVNVKITRTVTQQPSGSAFEKSVAESSAESLPPDDLLPDSPTETVTPPAAPVAAPKPKKRRVVSLESEDSTPAAASGSTDDASDVEKKLRAKLIATLKKKNPEALENVDKEDEKTKKKKKKKSSKKKDKKKDKADAKEKTGKKKKHKKDSEKVQKKSSSKKKKSKKKSGERSDGEIEDDRDDEQSRQLDELDSAPVRAVNSVIGVVASSIHRRPPTPPFYDDWGPPPSAHSSLYSPDNYRRSSSPNSRRQDYDRYYSRYDGHGSRGRSAGGYHNDRGGRGGGGGGWEPRSDGPGGTGGNTEPLGPSRRIRAAPDEDRPFAYHHPDEDRPGPSKASRPPRQHGPRGKTYRISSRSRSPERIGEPAAPKDMPEHLRWLHDRWRKYDSNFFSGGDGGGGGGRKESHGGGAFKSIDCTRIDRRPGARGDVQEARTLRDYYIPSSEDAAHDRRQAERNRHKQMAEARRGRHRSSEHDDRSSRAGGRGGEPEPNNNRAFYQKWRRGGTHQQDIGRMLTFKEWTLAQSVDIKEHEQAMAAYDKYKLQYRRRSLARFFQAHSEEEWFLEKYHPMLKQERESRRKHKVDRRLDAFMQLLVRGWMEVPLDLAESRKVRKLIDAMVVILEGGDEGDLSMLNELDYVLEEKKEESMINAEKDENESDSEEENEMDAVEGKAPGAPGRSQREQELDAQLTEMGVVTADEHGMVTATDLEAMQHAKDYSLYIHQHEEAGRLAVDLPDNLEPEGSRGEISNIGGGVFIRNLANSKGLQEMNLHRTSSVLIRNLAPIVTRRELEDVLRDVHGGFLRVRLLEPDPTANWQRQAIATFWHNANLTKIIWKLRGLELRGTQIQVIEWREFARRIVPADGVSGDKSVVLRDIQLCKSLIEHLDRRCQLWGSSENTNQDDAEPGEAAEGVPSANPLLLNLDECLAFHLHQLLKSRADGDTDKQHKQPDDRDTDSRIERDQNLTRVLDRLVLYLRLVHSVDYYGCQWHEYEDDEPRRISTMTLRAEPNKKATPKRLAKYIRTFEERLKHLLPHEKRLAEEHVEVLGKRSYDAEVDKFCDNNVLSIVDGMSKCCLCYKRFTGRKYAKLHLQEKHDDKIEEVKWIVLCFNNFLFDPTRPCNVELPQNEPVKLEQPADGDH